MREHTTRLELTRRLRAELHDAAAGAAALAALGAGDERALPRAEQVERMRLETQRLDLQLRVRRELRTAAYGAGKLASTAAEESGPVGARAREQLDARRRRAAATVQTAECYQIDLAVNDLDRSDREALQLPAASEPASSPATSRDGGSVANHARARLAERARRAGATLELGDRFGLDLALAELDPADRAALKLPDA